jgi:hypothetical protein
MENNKTKNFILICIFILGISSNVFSINYTSVGVGPVAWNVATSWSPNGIPTVADNVTIAAGNTITCNVISPCNNLTINGTLKGLTGMQIRINGNYVLNGLETGVGSIAFFTVGGTISGSGTSSNTISYTFGGNSSRTILAGSIITKTGTTAIASNASVTNLGTVTFGVINTAAGATFINSTNASLTIIKAGFMTGRTFTANASGNTVSLKYSTGAIPITTSGYFNLSIAGTISGTKTLAANTVVANNLTINSSNTLNSNNFDLSVGGNWTNSGIFTASAGKTVTFNGTAAQSVSNTAGTTTFKRIAVSNNNGVTLTTGTYILDEVLTVNSGTFNTNGRPFTMSSTATQTARIAPIGATGAIAGNFTIQRFITTRDTSFADFSSPVQFSTFADWDNELPAISYLSSPPSAEASAATYDEALDAYVPVTSSGTSLNAGQGFEVFLTGGFSYTNFPATTMTTVGVPNQGDFNLSGSVSSTVQGWNLVGNPFASSISWANVYAASGAGASGMADYFEMYDFTIADWNGFTSADGVEIGSTQGFWVYGDVIGSPMTLLIPELSKTTSSNSSIKAVKPSYFSLKLASANSSAAHIFKVMNNSDANDGLDKKDIPFRASLNKTTPEMYCMIEGKKININNFSSTNDNYSIPLKTKVNVSGNFNLSASGFDFVSEYTCIKLQDNLTGKVIDLTAEVNYPVTINVSDNADRFVLLFSKDANCKSVASASSASADFSNQVEVLPTAQGNIINFNLSETTYTTISVVNVLGQTVVGSSSVNANNQSVNITLPEGFSGMYIIKIESAKGNITKKFVKK